MTDIPHHHRSPLDHGRDEPDLSDEALDEVCEQLRYHNVRGKYGSVADTIAALRDQLAREREAGDRLVAAIDRTTDKAWASVATMEDAICLDAALAAFRAAREGGE